jgi:hypothetical protein
MTGLCSLPNNSMEDLKKEKEVENPMQEFGQFGGSQLNSDLPWKKGGSTSRLSRRWSDARSITTTKLEYKIQNWSREMERLLNEESWINMFFQTKMLSGLPVILMDKKIDQFNVDITQTLSEAKFMRLVSWIQNALEYMSIIHETPAPEDISKCYSFYEDACILR